MGLLIKLQVPSMHYCTQAATLSFISLLTLSVAAIDKGASGLNDYVLGTGDMIRIQVYDEEDLYLEARVSDHGTISYSFLGELEVIGLTPDQVRELITSKLK